LSRRDLLFALGLLVAVWLAYQPAWHGTFLWDDDYHVTRAELQSWSGLARIWTDVHATQQYYPVLHSAFWLEHRWFGDGPAGYHFVNLTLHALNAFLLLAALRALRVPGAWCAAAVFALHPVMVESVAWISELKNTLSTVFYLTAALAYFRFEATRRAGWYFGAFALFALALGTKTVTATLPGALLVLRWWRTGKLAWRADVLPVVPFFVVGAASGLFTAWVEVELIGAKGPEFALGAVERVLLAGRVLWFYAAKLAWPAELMFIYPRWHLDAGAWAQYVFPVGAIGLLLMLALAARCWRWRGPLATALFFGGTLLPVLGFFDVFPFQFSYVADHFQYLASLGLITAVAAGVTRFFARRRQEKLGRLAACLALAALAAATRAQSAMYRDLETLYTTTLARNPTCWLAHQNLGLLRQVEGRHEEAIAHFRAALREQPERPALHLNLGTSLAQLGRLEEAVPELEEALRLKPDYAKAHQNLGGVRLLQGRPAEALPHFAAAVRLSPGALERRGLARAYAQAGRPTEAIREYEALLRLVPGDAEATQMLARLQASP
jgi:tetratricopeptide (TPR) repeat protein